MLPRVLKPLPSFFFLFRFLKTDLYLYFNSTLSVSKASEWYKAAIKKSSLIHILISQSGYILIRFVY